MAKKAARKKAAKRELIETGSLMAADRRVTVLARQVRFATMTRGPRTAHGRPTLFGHTRRTVMTSNHSSAVASSFGWLHWPEAEAICKAKSATERERAADDWGLVANLVKKELTFSDEDTAVMHKDWLAPNFTTVCSNVERRCCIGGGTA